jgi:hypothetical protein
LAAKPELDTYKGVGIVGHVGDAPYLGCTTARRGNSDTTKVPISAFGGSSHMKPVSAHISSETIAVQDAMLQCENPVTVSG